LIKSPQYITLRAFYYGFRKKNRNILNNLLPYIVNLIIPNLSINILSLYGMSTTTPDNQITTKTITELLGHNFYIPNYQRGYRWTNDNVTQLLDDIWEYRNSDKTKSFYCLQPLVVRKTQWQDEGNHTQTGYELIDGQQRLTTIHRIITYLLLEHLDGHLQKEGYEQELYSLHYQTRPGSNAFLQQNKLNHDVPDFYYMSEAYTTIKNWFENGKNGIPRQLKDKMLAVLLPGLEKNSEGGYQMPEWSVQVIWYEVNDSTQESEDLFIRLNRGKIPLTSAELIKARFVNSESMKDLSDSVQLRRKTELIQLWDEMEAQLNDASFWAFITNLSVASYSNKIEILFDAITGKSAEEKDPLYTFLRFFQPKETSDSLWKKWIEVEEIYRSISYWFKDKNYYHKIGFLIATGTNIKALVKLKKEKTKNDFDAAIDEHIARKIPANWEDLRFDNMAHKEMIGHVLLLHNMEKLRMNQHSYEFFPFKAYKNIVKSLEHIHAQNIEDMDPRLKDPWKIWLMEHLAILKELSNDERVLTLEKDIEEQLPKLEFSEFKVLGNRILQLLPADAENNNDYLHKIENMALLGLVENIGLSNSVFEFKRRKIIEMDKAGTFLPIVTKRIFLKYYSEGDHVQHSIWTREERANYKKDINNTLEPYLSKKMMTNEK
jgi:hypothetical protein